jgi:hypothetical protein
MEKPYIDTLKATLDAQNKLLFLLQQRVVYLNSEIANCESVNYHTNEAAINIVKTNAEIETLSKVIFEKTRYFEKYAAQFEIEYAEMEKNYEMIMKNAHVRAAKNHVLKTMLEKVNKEALLTDMEAKLFFYKKVREQLA